MLVGQGSRSFGRFGRGLRLRRHGRRLFGDVTGETQYFLREAPASNETRLWFQDDPGLVPGTALTVWGERGADGIHVSRFDTDTTIGSTQQALIDAPPYPARTFAFVLVDI